MKFLNGWKTVLGVGGLVLSAVAPHYVPILPYADGVVQGAFGILTILGIVHKIEKAQ